MIPPALAPFLAMPHALRAAGFSAAPEQTEAFIAAVGLLGPASFRDIRRAARAIFGQGPERMGEFDAVFDQVFLGRAFAMPMGEAAESQVRVFDAGGFDLAPEADSQETSGGDASLAERLFARALTPRGEDQALAAFQRAAPAALPRRRSRRLGGRTGPLADPRRAFRQMMRTAGEITRLPARRRLTRQRQILLLIDVSGSMKTHTDGAMRLAHALVQAGERVEVFTLGTRLTRVSTPLHHHVAEEALRRASNLVADWDGGTRLGGMLDAFLALPRFATLARGALVIILSDGLERGGPETLRAAMTGLSRLAWSILWLSPLAADPAYRPETGALKAILPLLDRLGDGSAPSAMAGEILTFVKGGRA